MKRKFRVSRSLLHFETYEMWGDWYVKGPGVDERRGFCTWRGAMLYALRCAGLQ